MNKTESDSSAVQRPAGVTPWFSHTERPTRPGRYEIRCELLPLTTMLDWDGKTFRRLAGFLQGCEWGMCKRCVWRGLRRPAAAPLPRKRSVK